MSYRERCPIPLVIISLLALMISILISGQEAVATTETNQTNNYTKFFEEEKKIQEQCTAELVSCPTISGNITRGQLNHLLSL